MIQKKCESDLEKRTMKIRILKRKKKLNYNGLRDLSDNVKPININIIGDSKGEEREED